MNPTEQPQKPSLVVGWMGLALACLFAYYRARMGGSSDLARTLGFVTGTVLFTAAIFHFAIARKRGGAFVTVSYLAIAVCAGAGAAASFQAQVRREQMTQMAEGLEREMASVDPNHEPTAPIDTAPRAQGELGEMERFARTLMKRMSDVRSEYLRKIDAIGWPGVLDAERISKDEGLVQSKAMVNAARETVAAYREQALGLVDGATEEIDTLAIDESSKAGFRKGFEEKLAVSRGQLLEQLDLEARTVEEFGAIIDLLSTTRDAWAVREGQFEFAEDEPLAIFSAHAAEIDKMVARQQELQTQARDSTRADLERMKSRGPIDEH